MYHQEQPHIQHDHIISIHIHFHTYATSFKPDQFASRSLTFTNQKLQTGCNPINDGKTKKSKKKTTKHTSILSMTKKPYHIHSFRPTKNKNIGMTKLFLAFLVEAKKKKKQGEYLKERIVTVLDQQYPRAGP